MADYSTIKGFTIQSLASDPYASEVLAGTWASGGALTTARYSGGSAGTLTAGLCIGGQVPPRSAVTEEYDGTSWTAGGALNTARYYAVSAGTQIAAVMAGGNSPATPAVSAVGEEYNGTSWTTVNSMQTASTARASAGTQTAAFGCGGRDVPDAYMDQMETYNGTSWAEDADLNTAVSNAGGAGTTTAGLSFGGLRSDPSATGNTDATEEWDGTSWAVGGTMTSSNRDRGSSGTQTAALGFGGKGPPSNTRVAVTEAYDGSTWTEVADLATARDSGTSAKAGSQTSTFYAGGTTGSAVTTTEEFTAPSTTAVAQEGQVWYNTTSTVLKGYGLSVPGGAWSSGGTLNTGRAYAGGAGLTINTSMVFGGSTPGGNTVNTETYDGTTWTEVNNLNTSVQGAMGARTQTSAFSTSGKAPAQTTDSEIWDGTSWSEEANNNTARHYGAGAGTSTAAVIFSGGVWNEPAKHKLTEEWNGTSWTETADLVDAHMTNVGGFGLTSTSAMCVAGYTYPPGAPDVTTFVEEWNGTSWTEVTAIPTGAHYMRGSGATTSGIISGGQTPADIAKSQFWNGTAWAELTDLPSTKAAGTSAQNSPSGEGLYVGGTPAPFTVTSEWTTGNAIKTFTAS